MTFLPPVSEQHFVLQRADGQADADLAGVLGDRQVLEMIAEGLSTKQISACLKLSVKTGETYRSQIMEKLDIHDIASPMRYAIRQGIVPL